MWRRFCASNGTDPDQPVDPALGGQQPVGVLPVDHERGRLDPGFLAVVDLVQLHVEPLPLGPARVHPQEHLGPVLRLGAPRAGVHGGDRVRVVVLAGQEHGQLQLLQVPLERADRGRQLALELGVGAFLGQELVGGARIVHPALQRVLSLDLGVQPRELRGDLAGAIGVVPERRLGRLLLQLRHLRALALDVKGTPWRPRRVRRCRRDVRCGRSSARIVAVVTNVTASGASGHRVSGAPGLPCTS